MPALTYIAQDRDFVNDETSLLKTQEYAYSSLLTTTNELILKYVDMLIVQELNTQENSIAWQMSSALDTADYLHQEWFAAVDGETIEDSFYDLEVIIVKSRDTDSTRHLRVYEMLSPDNNVIVDVHREGLEVDGVAVLTSLSDAEVNFAVIKPISNSLSQYTLIVSVQDTATNAFSLLSFSFSARQSKRKTKPDGASAIGVGKCADVMQARGNLIVTLCRKEGTLTFYKVDDLKEITTIDVSYGGHWTQLGESGFELVSSGNGHLVFFTAFQRGSVHYCPF